MEVSSEVLLGCTCTDGEEDLTEVFFINKMLTAVNLAKLSYTCKSPPADNYFKSFMSPYEENLRRSAHHVMSCTALTFAPNISKLLPVASQLRYSTC